MNDKLESWLNWFFSCGACGLTAYVAARQAGAGREPALLSAGIAFCSAAQAHFRASPLESSQPSASASCASPSVAVVATSPSPSTSQPLTSPAQVPTVTKP